VLKVTQGKIAEYRFVSEFMKREYEVFLPTTEGTTTDLLVCKDNVFNRIQIKSTLTANGNKMLVKCRSSNTRGKRTYTLDDFDFLGVHDLVNDRGYLLPIKEVAGIDYITLRTSPTKNGQIKDVRYASEFIFF